MTRIPSSVAKAELAMDAFLTVTAPLIFALRAPALPLSEVVPGGGGEGGGMLDLNIIGACPKTYSASDIQGLDNVNDWTNIAFENQDGNLTYSVDTAAKEIVISFNNMNESSGTLAYEYEEAYDGGVSSGTGTLTFNNSIASNGAHYIKVDNFSDVRNNNHCNLRDALNSYQNPNSNTSYGGCSEGSADANVVIIYMAPSDINPKTITLSDTDTSEDLNSSGDLDVDCPTCPPVEIVGCGSEKTIISGANNDRIFDFNFITLTLEGMSLKDGNPPSGIGGAMKIDNLTLYLNDVIFKSNTARGPSGTSSDLGGGGGGAPGLGAAIYADFSFIYLFSEISFENNEAIGGDPGLAMSFDDYINQGNDLDDCIDANSFPAANGGLGGHTTSYDGSYDNGVAPYLNTPLDDFSGGFGGLSYYEQNPSETPHTGSKGTFGGGGGGAGNSFDCPDDPTCSEIPGGEGSLRAGDGGSSNRLSFTNGDGGAGGAFGGAIFLNQSELNLPFSENDDPTFSNNSIYLTAQEQNQSQEENIFIYNNSDIYRGMNTYNIQNDDYFTVYNCTNLNGYNCVCTNNECDDIE